MLTIQERLGDLRAARGLNYEQLAEETGLSMLEITKDGGESFLLADTIGSFLKRGAGND